MADTDDATRALQLKLERRRVSYARLFSLGNPSHEDVLCVMDDLAEFCRAYETTLNPNQKLQDAFEGRREVYLRIMDHILLDHDTLFKRYHSRDKRR